MDKAQFIKEVQAYAIPMLETQKVILLTMQNAMNKLTKIEQISVYNFEKIKASVDDAIVQLEGLKKICLSETQQITPYQIERRVNKIMEVLTNGEQANEELDNVVPEDSTKDN